MSTGQWLGKAVLIMLLLLMNIFEQRLNDNDLDGFPFTRPPRIDAGDDLRMG